MVRDLARPWRPCARSWREPERPNPVSRERPSRISSLSAGFGRGLALDHLSRKAKTLKIPAHFSLELPRRCMTLINELVPTAANVFADPKDGALCGSTSTFLLSMVGPILTLPIERIERQLQKKDGEGYADDRRLNQVLSDALKDELSGGRFQRAPFFEPSINPAKQPLPEGMNLIKPLLSCPPCQRCA